MGQGDILKIIEKEGKWMTQSEILKKVNSGSSSVNHSLKKLVEFKEIDVKEVKNVTKTKNTCRIYKNKEIVK